MCARTTADVEVSPSQAAEFLGWLDAWNHDLSPRNRVEIFLSDRAARTAWKLKETDKVEEARSLHFARTAPMDEKIRRTDEAIRIGHELIDPSAEEWLRYDLKPAGRDRGEHANSPPMTPERALHLLESTFEGCAWLRQSWNELAQLMRERLTWSPADEYKAIRLMGMTPDKEDNAEIRELRFTIIAFNGNPSRQVVPDGKSIPTRDEAQSYLLGLCARMDERLRDRQEQFLAAISPIEEARHGFDTTEAGKELRRHQSTLQRELLKSLETLAKLKKEPAITFEPVARAESGMPTSSESEEGSREDAGTTDREPRVSPRTKPKPKRRERGRTRALAAFLRGDAPRPGSGSEKRWDASPRERATASRQETSAVLDHHGPGDLRSTVSAGSESRAERTKLKT